MKVKNVTLKISLAKKINEGLKVSKKAIEDTRNDAKTFWVGYNAALQEIQQRFHLDKIIK